MLVPVCPFPIEFLVAGLNFFLQQFDHSGDVEKLGLLEDPLLADVLVQDQLPVAKVVQNGSEVGGLAVDEEGTRFVLKIHACVCNWGAIQPLYCLSLYPVRTEVDVFCDGVQRGVRIFGQGGARRGKEGAADIEADPRVRG